MHFHLLYLNTILNFETFKSAQILEPILLIPILNNIEKKTVIYDQYDNELNLEAGDMVDLLRHIDHEWLEGNTSQHKIHQNTNMCSYETL